jgi:multiple sugar transport system permease protein
MQRMSAMRARNLRNGLLFASPWLLGFLIFVLYPLLASLYYSFTDYNIIKPPQWVGLDNVRALLTDSLFWTSMGNTLYMVVFGLPAGLAVSLLLAILLNQKVAAMPLFRTIFYLPSIMPAVASALLFLWVLNPQYGMINLALRSVGIAGPGWMTDPAWSKPALIILGLWTSGGTMLIYLAGLQGIPVHLYEAAMIDGANWWHKFWHVTIPMLSPTIFFNLIIGLIGTVQYFTEAYIMTTGNSGGSNDIPGGPLNSTMFYSIYLFQNGFAYFKMGFASAMAWILFLIVLAATLLIFKTSARWVYYEGAH